jgi:hypothetical protein
MGCHAEGATIDLLSFFPGLQVLDEIRNPATGGFFFIDLGVINSFLVRISTYSGITSINTRFGELTRREGLFGRLWNDADAALPRSFRSPHWAQEVVY